MGIVIFLRPESAGCQLAAQHPNKPMGNGGSRVSVSAVEAAVELALIRK